MGIDWMVGDGFKTDRNDLNLNFRKFIFCVCFSGQVCG
jgi:hypothetical protein